MSYIDLFDDQGYIDRYHLPATVRTDAGQSFRLGKVLRMGGNGVVLEAGRPTGGTCAVKFLRRLDQQRRDRFANEIRVLHELDHHRIARAYGDGSAVLSDLSVPWMAMELGGDNLRRHVETNGPLAVPQLLRTATQASEALNYVHAAGFIHRDIKPDNFVWDRSVPGSIQMIDFGIAKRVGEDVSARPLDQFTQHMEFVGPVFFSSPELIAYANDKSQPVDARSDLFQLGKVLWYLGTGRISAGIPSKRDCPMGGLLRDLVMDLLPDEPDERIQSAAEVGERILSLQA